MHRFPWKLSVIGFVALAACHPEFQLKREHACDPNVLRFNHQRHYASDIPLLNGQRLDCISSHKIEADGHFMRRISFTANCQACHSLQFDPRNPELMLPHGDSDAVRAFLRTLSTQYAELAAKRGLYRADHAVGPLDARHESNPPAGA